MALGGPPNAIPIGGTTPLSMGQSPVGGAPMGQGVPQQQQGPPLQGGVVPQNPPEEELPAPQSPLEEHEPEARQTLAPDVGVRLATPKLSREKRGEIASRITVSLQNAQGQRAELDEQLVFWNKLYEMETEDRDWPWPDASNVFVPFLPSEVDKFVAWLSQECLQPRTFIVKGNTEIAEARQHRVEQYYNIKAMKLDWIDAFAQWIHLAARDGTSPMEVLWHYKTHVIKIERELPDTIQDENGVTVPAMELVDGQFQPRMKKEIVPVEVVEYDDVKLTPVELKDFIMFPAYALSVESARAVGVAKYLTDVDLDGMVAAGDMWEDAVEFVKKSHGGRDEMGADPSQSTDTLTAGGLIAVGEEATGDESTGQYTGVYKVWRIHSREFDLDGDGRVEENIFWYHESTQKLLGVQAYQYHHGKRPLVLGVPMPRPNRVYGYSACGRLAPIQVEINSDHNHRNDEIDLRLSPPRYRRAGVTLITEDQPWGPGTEYEVGQPDDVGILPVPDVNASAWEREQMLIGYGREMLGLNPESAMAQPQKGMRMTRQQAQMMYAAAQIRVSLCAKRMLRAMREIFWQIHELTKQYGKEQDTVSTTAPGGRTVKFTVTKDDLRQDYELDINGTGSPIDKGSRRQEKMFLYSMLMQNPLVQGNLPRVYNVTQWLMEDYEVTDVTPFIGTEEEAKQAQQQKAQLQQVQLLMALKNQQQGQYAAGANAGARHPAPQQRGRKKRQMMPLGGGF